MTGPAPPPAASESPALELGQWRHELNTPLNLIVGYCEMMLEDARAAGDELRVAPLTEALAAARDAMSTIHDLLPATGEAESPAIAALEGSMRMVHDRITAATDRAMATAAAVADPSVADDLARVREAAGRLTAVAEGLARSEAGSGASARSEPGGKGGVACNRVLIVDDIEANRELLARRLRREGCEVSLAASGPQALEALRRDSFDLVLLDVIMPGMNGIDVLKRMKADEALREIPVLMVSALDDMENVVHCIENGAEDYLPKPFNAALLRARVHACLEKRRLRATESEYMAGVRVLTQAAAEVEKGSSAFGANGLEEVALRSDELGKLARVFRAMAEGVRAHEERLHAQLAALRSELHDVVAQLADDGSVPELAPGVTLADRYVIEALIGSGGMGVVYRALDRELGDPVAVKLLRRDLVGDSVARERFKTEIRLARRISHPNVVRTHDFGEADGSCFVTMELVEGVTLRRLLDARGALSITAGIAVGAQLARALETAHGQGILHRDVKPQNLLVDPSGVLKVMDFGIARIAIGGNTLTQTGMVVGTPAYMAPEQLLGEDVDARADLYSVGVVLYEAFTGALPFAAPTPLMLLGRMLSSPAPDPRLLRAELPPPLGAIIGRLLARDRNERPSTARELAEVLERIATPGERHLAP